MPDSKREETTNNKQIFIAKTTNKTDVINLQHRDKITYSLQLKMYQKNSSLKDEKCTMIYLTELFTPLFLQSLTNKS